MLAILLWLYLSNAFTGNIAESISMEGFRGRLNTDMFVSNPKSMVSFVQSLDKSALQSATTSSSRRRTVHDVDCDDIEHHIDTVEDSCENRRYNVLVNIMPNFTNLTYENTSVASDLSRVSMQLFGDPSNPNDPPGLWPLLYSQKVSVLGGVDPVSNMTVPGLAQKFSDTVSQLKSLSDQQAASLDELWNALDQSVQVASDRVYTPVMNFTSSVESMMNDLQSSSTYALSNETALMAQYTQQAQDLIKSMVDDLCKYQKLVDGNETNLSNTASSVLPEMQAVVNAMMDSANAVMDQLAQAQDQGQQSLDDFLSKAETYLANGQTDVSNLAQKFQNSYMSSVDKLIATFASTASQQGETALSTLSLNVLNGTQNLLDQSNQVSQNITAMRAQMDDKIASMKSVIDQQLAAIAAGQQGAFSAIEGQVFGAQSNATGAVNSLSSAKKEISTQFDDAYSEVSANLNDTQKSVAHTLQSSNAAASQSLQQSVDTLSSLRNQLSSVLSSKQTNLQSSLSKAQTVLASGNFAHASSVSDQLSTVDVSGALSHSNMQTMHYGSQLAITSSMRDVQNRALATASSAAGVGSSVSQSTHQAQQDTHAAVATQQEDLSQQLSLVQVVGHETMSSGYDMLAGNMSQAQSGIESTRNVLANLVGNYSGSISGSVQNLQFSKSQWDSSSRNSIAAVSDNLANVDSITANALQDSLDSSSQSASGLISSAEDQVRNRTNGAVNEAVISPISKIESALKTLNTPMISVIDPSVASKLRSIEIGVEAQAREEGDTVNGFRSTVHAFSEKADLLANQSAVSAQKVFNRAVNPLLDQLRQSLGSNYVQLTSFVDKLLSEWTPGFAADIDSKLSALLSAAAPEQVKLANAESSFNDTVEQYDEKASSMANTVQAADADFRQQLADLQLKMQSEIDSRVGQVKQLMSDNVTAITDEINRLVDEYQQELLLRKSNISSSVSAAQSGVRDDLSSAWGTTVSPEDLIALLQDLYASARSAQSDSSSVSQDLSAFSDQAASQVDSAKALLKQDTDGSAEALNSNYQASQSMQSQLQKAILAANKTLANSVSQTNASTAFSIGSFGAQTSTLTSLSANAVNGTQTILAEGSDAINGILAAASDGWGATNGDFADLTALSNSGISALSDGASGLSSAVSANVSLDQQVQQFNSKQIRNLVAQLSTAWGTYSDYEWSKFDQMDQQNRDSLSVMSVTASNGLTEANSTVAQLEAKINNLTSAFNASVEQEGSASNLNETIANATTMLNQFMTNSTDLANYVESELNQTRTNFTNDNNTAVQDATQQEFVFEQMIDGIMNKVMRSVVK